jgi:hypothetical protein
VECDIQIYQYTEFVVYCFIDYIWTIYLGREYANIPVHK